MMSITIYFAKLNLISEELFSLYDDPKLKADIEDALYKAIHTRERWEKESVFFDESGEPHNTIVEYSLHILNMDSSYTFIEGRLYKKSRLFYKTLDETSNELISRSTENTEGIRFTLDIKHGFVGYNRSARFGYREFLDAFVTLINKGEAAAGFDYRYNIGLCSSGISLDDIKTELKKVGRIKELRIRMQPPNPNDDLLDELQAHFDGVVKNFSDANVTGLDILYSTTGSSGINLEAPFVKERLDDIQGLHSALSVEETTKNGYAVVDATSTAGRKYSSGDSKPFKRIVDRIDGFFEACIDAFHELW